VPLAEVPADLVEADFDLLETFDGLVMQPFTSRYYFGGGIASQAIGYVSLIQPEEAGTYQRLGYRVDERIGRIGLEKWGEPFLAGTRGGALYAVSPEGERLTLLAESQAGPAGSIFTTLDRSLQTQLQNALEGFTGAVVVLERDTGRILALVSSPGYDPNLFEPTNFNSDYLLGGLLNDPRTPLLNRATQGQYPLGSVFKIITMAAALESGRYTPASSYYCGHYFTEIAGLSRADWTVAYQVPPSGQLDLREGLMRSCNPWFWHIGLDFFNVEMDEQISGTALGFGLGAETGLGQIVEAGGNIPVPVNPIDAINLAIGQGDTLVTPLQVARFIAAIGNGGELLRPQLIEQVVSGAGEPVYRFKVESSGPLPVTAETLAALREGLDWVVNQPRGTAYFRFTGLEIPVAGKTGTAEAPPGDPHAWFAGYTLADDPALPDLAIAVVLEHAGEGSQVAAPLFRRAVEIYFHGRPLTLLPWEEELPAQPPEN
jgi:penicillin-binding protein 2